VPCQCSLSNCCRRTWCNILSNKAVWSRKQRAFWFFLVIFRLRRRRKRWTWRRSCILAFSWLRLRCTGALIRWFVTLLNYETKKRTEKLFKFWEEMLQNNPDWSCEECGFSIRISLIAPESVPIAQHLKGILNGTDFLVNFWYLIFCDISDLAVDKQRTLYQSTKPLKNCSTKLENLNKNGLLFLHHSH